MGSLSLLILFFFRLRRADFILFLSPFLAFYFLTQDALLIEHINQVIPASNRLVVFNFVVQGLIKRVKEVNVILIQKVILHIPFPIFKVLNLPIQNIEFLLFRQVWLIGDCTQVQVFL